MEIAPAIIQANIFDDALLIHGFSTKGWGNMSRALERDPKRTAQINDSRFLRQLDIDPLSRVIVNPTLTHSTNIAFLEAKRDVVGYTEVSLANPCITKVAKTNDYSIGLDAVFTQDRKLVLTMRPADCAIVYIFDPLTQTIGLIHVGTAGLLGGLLENSMNFLKQNFVDNLQRLFVWVAPSISGSAYDLSKTNIWKKHLSKKLPSDFAKYYDPKDLIWRTFTSFGVIEENIEISPYCTASDPDLFFSHHRCQTDEERATEGRMIAVLALR